MRNGQTRSHSPKHVSEDFLKASLADANFTLYAHVTLPVVQRFCGDRDLHSALFLLTMISPDSTVSPSGPSKFQ